MGSLPVSGAACQQIPQNSNPFKTKRSLASECSYLILNGAFFRIVFAFSRATASMASQVPPADDSRSLRSRTANNTTTSNDGGSNRAKLPKILDGKKYQSKGTATEASITWKLRPLRLLKEDAANIKSRYWSDWTTINQQVIASSVYMFFTNILPGITFANDLNELTGASWGTIEVVFSTGLCGVIFSLLAFWSANKRVIHC